MSVAGSVRTPSSERTASLSFTDGWLCGPGILPHYLRRVHVTAPSWTAALVLPRRADSVASPRGTNLLPEALRSLGNGWWSLLPHRTGEIICGKSGLAQWARPVDACRYAMVTEAEPVDRHWRNALSERKTMASANSVPGNVRAAEAAVCPSEAPGESGEGCSSAFLSGFVGCEVLGLRTVIPDGLPFSFPPPVPPTDWPQFGESWVFFSQTKNCSVISLLTKRLRSSSKQQKPSPNTSLDET